MGSGDQRAASGEPKGVRIEDVNAISWVWHDAEVRSFAFVYDGKWHCDAVLRCVINFEEDRSRLIALGIATPGVEVRFRDISDAKVSWVHLTGHHVTVDRWDKFEPRKHRIQCHGGSRYELVCEDVWLAETEDELIE